MSETTISRRYAQALIDKAGTSAVLDRVDADIALIKDALSSSKELEGMFKSPIISREKKSAVVRALFTEKVDRLTLQFLELLVEKRREGLFSDVVKAYREIRDGQLGVVGVTARTALALTESDLNQLKGSLEKFTGNKIRLETKIDSSILGGIVIRVGDTVYDASVVNQLATLRVRLESGSMV